MPPAADVPVPLRLLWEARDAYPGVWRAYDEVYAHRDALGGWPDYIHVPLPLSARMVAGPGQRIDPEHVVPAQLLGALAAWRPTQGIYRFDDELAAALDDTPLDREIPVDILRSLPEWCVWIDTPGYRGLGAEIVGYWARLDRFRDIISADELVFVLVHADGSVTPTCLPLSGGSLVETLERHAAESRRLDPSIAGHQAPVADVARGLAPLISRVLYLCSAAPDVQDARGGARTPTRASMVRRTKGKPPVVPAAQRETVWETGYRIGAAIRRGREARNDAARSDDATGRSVTPHVRRAHWHMHWVGAMDSAARRRELRWHAPALVGLDDVDDLVAVVRRVRKNVS